MVIDLLKLLDLFEGPRRGTAFQAVVLLFSHRLKACATLPSNSALKSPESPHGFHGETPLLTPAQFSIRIGSGGLLKNGFCRQGAGLCDHSQPKWLLAAASV